MDSKPLKVLIVGCGNIAGKFDEVPNNNEYPITHAGAFTEDNRYEIIGCVEPNKKRRHDFTDKWNIPRNFEQFKNIQMDVDIVSICSPSNCHYEDIKSAIQLKPKLIFCEKPITTSISQSKEVVEICNKFNIDLCINYSRRWDHQIHKLKKDIKALKRGPLRSITGFYNKGLLNNGSHIIDLLTYLLDDLKVIDAGMPINDYFDDDPSVPVWLEDNKHIPIFLNCGHSKDFSFFELQFIFEKGVLTMEDGGMKWRERKVISSALYDGYKVLDKGMWVSGDYNKSMKNALDNIWDKINMDTMLASNGVTALKTQKICSQILNKI